MIKIKTYTVYEEGTLKLERKSRWKCGNTRLQHMYECNLQSCNTLP